MSGSAKDDLEPGLFDDLDASLHNQIRSFGHKPCESRLQTIQKLIKLKQNLRKKEMKATISNEFINQFVITSLINKQWIK